MSEIRITTKKKGRHLTKSQRCMIEAMLNEKFSMRHIADSLDCAASTISREIKRNTKVIHSRSNDCINRGVCKQKHACGSTTCNGICKNCGRCRKHCDDYMQRSCETLMAVGLCNGCKKFSICHQERKIYLADNADKKYRESLIGSRDGFDLTNEQILEIDRLVSPLIKKGQSPYHIKQSLGNSLPISESTLRRMIRKNELSVCQLDLKEAVRRKPRKRQFLSESRKNHISKAGRMYSDYLDYVNDHEINVVEMDCVEGLREDKCVILTLHFVVFHLQLYFIMPEHTSECVVEILDKIEVALGNDLFAEMFEVILTDNGHEFSDIAGMEKSINGSQRTKIFFCEPNRSDQKGACERNHKLLREIIPKGTSIDTYMQSDMTLVTNHINSYRRKSLFGKSPYEMAMCLLPQDFFTLLGLELIESEQVNMSPSLLKNNT